MFLLMRIFQSAQKIFSNVKKVQPFLQAGIGVSQCKNYTAAFMPIGAGIQVNVFQDVYITLQTKYSLPLGSAFRDYFSHSLGIAGVIGKPRRKPAVKNVAPPLTSTLAPADRDRDGGRDIPFAVKLLIYGYMHKISVSVYDQDILFEPSNKSPKRITLNGLSETIGCIGQGV